MLIISSEIRWMKSLPVGTSILIEKKIIGKFQEHTQFYDKIKERRRLKAELL